MSALLLLVLAPMAQAQDADLDGCVNVFFDANGACVSLSATLGEGVTVGAGVSIQPNASVGADVAVGDGVVIASRATLVGRVNAIDDLAVGAGTIIGRRTVIGADHAIGANNILGRAVAVGERLESADNVTVSYGSTVFDDVFLGTGATLGTLVTVGSNTHIAPSTVLARNVTIADSSSLETPASVAGVIGPSVSIGLGADMHSSARIRKNSTLGNRVTVRSGVRIGRDANIGDDAVLGENVRIQAGGVVTATTIVPDNTVVRRGETYDAPTSVSIAGESEVVTLPGGESMTFRGIPAGTFDMGCKPGRDGPFEAEVFDPLSPGPNVVDIDCDESTEWQDGLGWQEVTLTQDFWCGETEVTQAQFVALSGHNPSYFAPGGGGSWADNSPNPPVENVSWHDAAWYTNQLTAEYNAQFGASLTECYACSGGYSSGSSTAPGCSPTPTPYACDGFRLPTEAEWEYAARGGNYGPGQMYSGATDVNAVAWYNDNKGWWTYPDGGSQPTATLTANGYGLFDTGGNVYEWTNDWSNGAPYPTYEEPNPTGATPGSLLIIRGGHMVSNARAVRTARRNVGTLDARVYRVGFRVCRSVP